MKKTYVVIICLLLVFQYATSQILTPKVKVELTNSNFTGIGTTDPTASLSIRGTSNNRVLDAYQKDTNAKMFVVNTSGGYPHLTFYDNLGTTEKIKLNTNGNSYFKGGNIGVGTISPTADIHVLRTNNTASSVHLEAYENHFAIIEANSSGGVINMSDNSGTSSVMLRGYGESYFDAGNVGIGTSNITGTLSIRGISSNRVLDAYQKDTNAKMFVVNTSGGYPHLTFYNNLGDTEKIKLRTNGNSFFNGGNVGIGTSAPNGQLEIKGPYNGNSQLIINTTSSNGELRFSESGVSKGYVWYSASNDLMAFGRGNITNSFFATSDGKFGIGITNPSEKLHVNGNIRATAPVWADFVFEKEYKLRTLEEVEDYISKNKHLPEIPSEPEVAENGINLGEMDAKLLQKIEELTLYLIEQNKRIDKLEAKNAELEKEISTLKNE